MYAADIGQFKSRECDYHIGENDSLLKFTAPATLLLVSQSNSGKTRYMQKLVENGDRMFTILPSKYVWMYTISQDLYDDVEKTSMANVCFVQGLPSRSDTESWAENERHLVLLVDNLYNLMIHSRDILDLFVLLCHHLTVTVIISCHNIFVNSQTMTKSCITFYCSNFKIAYSFQHWERSCSVTAKKAKHFVRVYDAVMEADQFSPLVIDLSPQSRHSDYKLRSNILQGELPIIYELE